MEKSFEVIARALVVKDGKILVCRAKSKGYYFLPGGHVEAGETSKEAIIREMEEERGSQLENISFIGVVENIFPENGKERYEINIVFAARENISGSETKTKESHISFHFLSVSDFEKSDVRPIAVKQKIPEYLKKGEIFWTARKDR